MPDPTTKAGPLARDVTLPGLPEPMGPEDAERLTRAISRALRRAAHRARAPASVIVGGGGFAVRRGDRMFRHALIASFAALALAPLIVASIYWGLIASNQYVTETKFSLQSADSGSWAMLGVSNHDEKVMQDSQVVAKYILSRSMIEALDQRIDLRKRFSRSEGDYLSRFNATAPIEKLEKYWKKRVDASVDLMSGVIAVNVRAFTPEDSLLITRNIIELSEMLVNELSTRSRRDALSHARAELTRAENRLKDATGKMADTRNAQGVLDASAAAEATNKFITQLRLELAQAQQSLALQTSANALQSPQVRLLDARVASLKKQIQEYTAQIASKETDGSLADRERALSEQKLDLAVAQQQYALAATAYESARVDLDRQRTYLAPFLKPALAEKSLYPRRWLEWFIIVGPSLLLWSLLTGIGFVVRDHMAK